MQQAVEQLLSQWAKTNHQNGHGKFRAPQDEIVIDYLNDLVRQRLAGKSDDTVGKTTLKILFACRLTIEVSSRRASTLSQGERHAFQLAQALAAGTTVIRDFDLFHGVEDAHVLGINLKRYFSESDHSPVLISSTMAAGGRSLQPDLVLLLEDGSASLERRDPATMQIGFDQGTFCLDDDVRKTKQKDSGTAHLTHCHCSSMYVMDRSMCHERSKRNANVEEDQAWDKISIASKKTIEFTGHNVDDLQQHCRHREQPRPTFLTKEISRDAYAKGHYHDQALTGNYFLCLTGGTGQFQFLELDGMPWLVKNERRALAAVSDLGTHMEICFAQGQGRPRGLKL